MAHVPGRSRGAALVRARSSFAARHVLLPFQRFVHMETISGVVLLGAALLALAWANSSLAGSYDAVFNAELAFHAGPFTLAHTVRDWINDALMVLFFFVVGLEVKREFVHGGLAELRSAALPIAAALGGMIVPAAVYLALNAGGSTARGWGIPMATDIAFALGLLALAGPRVPASVRIFLLALATVDDIGAILVIAVFYSGNVNVAALGAAAVLLIAMLAMQRLGVQTLFHYAPLVVLFWFCVLASGVHATIAGVVLGLITPATSYQRRRDFPGEAAQLVADVRHALSAADHDRADVALGRMAELTAATESPADRLVRVLHPWSSFLVLPIFALANAGVPLSPRVASEALASAISQGVFLGLVLGKPLGIVSFAWLAVRLRFASLPQAANWKQLTGAGILAGIGFTVSLFIADLAFTDAAHVALAKLAVLTASLLAGLAGLLFIRVTAAQSPTPSAARPADS